MGMARLNVQMKTTVNRVQLLDTLRRNRDAHAVIVKEAQEGYLVAAQKAVQKCHLALIAGRIISLQKFALSVPVDYPSGDPVEQRVTLKGLQEE